MTRIAVIGDAHLGFRQYGLAEREADFDASFNYVMNRCKELKIKNIIFAGDLFNTTRPSAESVLTVHKQCNAGHFNCIGIEGNHDITSNNSWLSICGIESIPTDKVIQIDGVNIAGLNWCRPAIFMETLDAYLKTINTNIDIFCMHQLVDEFIPYSTGQISAVEIAGKLMPFGVTHVIMGDLHTPVDMQFGGMTFSYTGSTEITAINEKDDKSFIILDVTDSGSITMTRESIQLRPFVHKYIQTEADLQKILKEYIVDGTKKPFLILEYDSATRELANRASTVLQDKALFRLIPLIKDIRSDLMAQISTEQFERKGVMKHLHESIAAFFDPKSDEFQLVTHILETPNDINDLFVSYGKAKGLI